MRALTRLDQLYAIGAGTRLGYSPEEDAAHELAARWLQQAGLDVTTDEAGNLFGHRGDARIWSGSHLDTVPNGGRFDGALGVVAAIEAANRLPGTELGVPGTDRMPGRSCAMRGGNSASMASSRGEGREKWGVL